jgi:hypothetical protein
MNLEDTIELTKKIDSVAEKAVNVFVAGARERVEKPFVMIFYDTLTELIMENKIQMQDMKVMLGICKAASFGNLVHLNQGGLAELIGVHKSNVSKSIKKLTAIGLLLETKLGLFLNPSLIVKGQMGKIDADVWDASLLKTPDAYPLKRQRGTKTAKQVRAEATREVETTDVVDEEIKTDL